MAGRRRTVTPPADERPRNATDLSNQTALRQGRARRWLIPSTGLAAIGLVLFALAIPLQPVLGVVGIILTVALTAAMWIVAVRVADAPARNRAHAWLMGAMAVEILALLLVLWFLEANA